MPAVSQLLLQVDDMPREESAPKNFLVKRNRTRPTFPAAETRRDGLDKVDSAGPAVYDFGLDQVDSAGPAASDFGLDQDDSAGPAASDDDDVERRGTGCGWSFATLFEIVCYLFFALLYVIDCGSDIWTAKVYISDHEDWYFWMTFIIVAVSSVTLIMINLYWYYCEYKDDKAVRPDDVPPMWVWAMRIILTLCLLGPFLRCMEICRLGVKNKRAKDKLEKAYYRRRMDLEIHDVAILGLIECYVESAPQLGVQLYIMQTQGPEADFRLVIQTVSCISSWLSCASTMVSYSRANRVARPMKEQLTYPAMSILFVWRLFTIGPRILALALFASVIVIRYYVIVAIAGHWLLMITYIISRKTNYCNDKFFEILFNMLVGFIYIFTFWNIEDGHTRFRYTFYYILIYLENLCMVVTWFLLTTHAGEWYYIPSFLFVIIGFLLGVAFMLAYYMGCHPKTIKICLTGDESESIIHKDIEQPDEDVSEADDKV